MKDEIASSSVKDETRPSSMKDETASSSLKVERGPSSVKNEIGHRPRERENEKVGGGEKGARTGEATSTGHTTEHYGREEPL